MIMMMKGQTEKSNITQLKYWKVTKFHIAIDEYKKIPIT